MLEQSRPVPVRTILAVIGLVLATAVALWLFVRLARIESILVVAAFFAVVLNPVVELVQRFLHLRRGFAVAIVFIVVFGLLGAMLYAFISPLVHQGQKFADDYPRLVREAKAGKGPVGGLVKRYKLDDKLDENRKKINEQFGKIGGGAFNVAKSVAAAVAVAITVIVLALLMILYGPDMLKGALGVLSPPRRRRVEAVLHDCSRALTGYVFGNFLISIIAGGATFVALLILDVPFRGVLALWVGFADLIPLVGATLGAVPAVLVAFLSSTTDGIAVLIFFIAYQQFENHVLQVQIMARTVQINQLIVLVSVLVGVELFGLLGALLAIPAAGVIQVIARDLWDNRRNRPKDEPTIGADEIPVSQATDVEAEELHDDVTGDHDDVTGDVGDVGDEPPPPTQPTSPVQTT
ncbi:MAG: AI-2E family transporter [Actinobacteria bacterium]|nr:MAG: AI-2E family transporter [Actinomycetota bacterium]